MDGAGYHDHVIVIAGEDPGGERFGRFGSVAKIGLDESINGVFDIVASEVGAGDGGGLRGPGCQGEINWGG